jgi:HD-GYP domain-containing protein (c-di-GMP phosphodiesterase class II)
MRLMPVTRAVGLTLARDLPATQPGQLPLLRAGVTLTDGFVRSLTRQGMHAVWVHDALSDGIEPVELLPEAVRAEASAGVHRALTAARAAFDRGQPLPPAVVAELSAVVDLIAAQLAASPTAALVLGDLAAADQYTHRHSVNVTALGLLIARTMYRNDGWTDYRGRQRFDRIDVRLSRLGVGLLLHDVGKMAVPADVLNKPGPLSEEEWTLMRGHPEAGVALLATSGLGPMVKGVVRNHHERWDGSGYPRGLEATANTQFARVAAVADVYDAVTSQRPYRAAMTAREGVRLVADGAGTAFDPEVVAAFRRVVFPHPVGTELVVDDQLGVVAANHPDHPDRPVVRFDGPGGGVRQVDLRD